jgi:hypothetical protein
LISRWSMRDDVEWKDCLYRTLRLIDKGVNWVHRQSLVLWKAHIPWPDLIGLAPREMRNEFWDVKVTQEPPKHGVCSLSMLCTLPVWQLRSAIEELVDAYKQRPINRFTQLLIPQMQVPHRLPPAIHGRRFVIGFRRFVDYKWLY